jgi:cytochrome c-type biogenesis protein CcmE
MELTPRTTTGEPTRPSRSARRRALPIMTLILVVGALGMIVYMALDEAATYFYNADEAVERRDSLGDSRFRLQGMVLDGVEQTEDGAAFDVVHNCVVVHVRHSGDPPQMFDAGIPAVVEGRWAESGDHVQTDRLFVAHDSEYQEAGGSDEYDDEDYSDRVAEAEASGAYDVEGCAELVNVEGGATADAE